MLLVGAQDHETSTMHLERRRGLRVAQAWSVQVYEPAASRLFGATTRNVSHTGLQLELPQHVDLRPGRLINVQVGMNPGPRKAGQSSMRPARVVWVSDDERGNAVLAGVEFLAHVTSFAGAA
jgi:hypothetical protein